MVHSHWKMSSHIKYLCVASVVKTSHNISSNDLWLTTLTQVSCIQCRTPHSGSYS